MTLYPSFNFLLKHLPLCVIYLSFSQTDQHVSPRNHEEDSKVQVPLRVKDFQKKFLFTQKIHS